MDPQDHEIFEAIEISWTLFRHALSAMPTPIALGDLPRYDAAAKVDLDEAVKVLKMQTVPTGVVTLVEDMAIQWRVIRDAGRLAIPPELVNPRKAFHREVFDFSLREFAAKVDLLQRWQRGQFEMPLS